MFAFQEQLHVLHCFGISRRSGQVFDAWTQAAFDVVLQAGTRMEARQVDLARGYEKVAVNQVHNAIGQVGGEVRAVIKAAIFPQAAGDVNAGKALPRRQFYIGICLIIPQKYVVARLFLLDEVVFQRQRLFFVINDDVLNIYGVTQQGISLRLGIHPLAKIGAHPRPQALGLTYINHLAGGVFVQVNSG